MRKATPWILLRIGAAVAASLITSPARASEIQITVTNDQPAGGFALAPVWFGIQDGTFTTFTPGSSASAGITRLAQFGDTSVLSTAFENANVGVDTTLTSGNAVKQFLPGQSNSTTLTVSNPAHDQFLSFAGMVVPSNDFFMGNATPLQAFDATGTFKGPMTIQIYGSNIWDSDTEMRSTTTALTFIMGQNPGTGTQIADGTIRSLYDNPTDSATDTAFLKSIVGLTTAPPPNYVIGSYPTSGQLLATIQINSVPEPASIVLFGTGIIGLIVIGRSSASQGPRAAR